MFKNIIYLSILIILSQNIHSKSIEINGLNKLSENDIQTITSKDIYNINSSISDINIIIKELIKSDLIYDVNFKEVNESFIINISESNIIENIYINNNIRIKDDLIIQNLSSKANYFLNKNDIQDDVEIIKKIYFTKGFQDISVIAKVEKYSSNRVNLIYYLNEEKQQRINIIKFIGNSYFSDNYLNSIIKSQSIKFYNIFKSGSNLNYSIFDSDKNQISSAFRDEGFLDVKVSYILEKDSFNTNVLKFYIEEGERVKINQIKYNYKDSIKNQDINNLEKHFESKIKKNNYFFSRQILDEFLDELNFSLISNNIHNFNVNFDIKLNDGNVDIEFSSHQQDIVSINKIEISGNSITKNKTIRSKLLIEPGEYLNQYSLDKSIKILNKYPYIKNVETNTIIENQKADIFIDIDEELKTGNIMLAGTFNADTGLGVTFGIEDKNIFGSGNGISSNFTINSEDLKFDIQYKQYPILNPNLTNTYSIYNQENDYTGSYGYKATRKGLGYLVNFKESDTLTYGLGFVYESFKGHSAKNTTSNAINDNIGSFENYKLRFSILNDGTNNYLNPTDGILNRINIEYSPEDISDNSFYKINISNKNYFQLSKSSNFVFLNNSYGFAKSLNSKLKTIDTFGLGGLNFKGFDYKGIGPYDGSIYLGGNEFFTTTLGYGSSFLFDEKDNINIKVFITNGSIWNSDYSSSNDIDIRTSAGASFDFITAIGPISLSYAVPIEKNSSDKTRPFNFSIGTSF